MKIVLVSGVEIQACVKFMYKGYEISASNIFTPAELVIYPDSTSNHPASKEHFYATAEGIRDAMKWIDDNAS